MKTRFLFMLTLVVILAACSPSEDVQLLRKEYDALSEEKIALTEQMVKLNMGTEEAEQQSMEIESDLGPMEARLTEEQRSVDELMLITDELAAEEAVLNEVLTVRKNLVNGWQLYHSVPKIVAAQENLNNELDLFTEVILTAREMQLKFINGNGFAHGTVLNEGIIVSGDTGAGWYRLAAPYDTQTNMMVRLMDGYSHEAAREIMARNFTDDPNSREALFLNSDGRLYGKEMPQVSVEGSLQKWDQLRCFVTELTTDKAVVRVVLPVMDYGDGIWEGDEEAMHFYDHLITLTKTEYGWKVSHSEFPGLQ